PRSLATPLSSVMVLSLSSDRFILLPPAPPESDAAVSVASDFCGEGRLGLRCEMAISGGLNVYGELGSTSILNFPQRAPLCQFKPSEAHLDDGLAADLRQPLLEPRLVLLLVQDVANLVAGLRELLARQRLLGVELEEVIADLGPEGRGVLTRREPQDGRLDVRGQLAPLEHAEPTAVLGRARVLGILAREIAEVLAREHAAVDLVGATPRRRPAVLARAGPGHEEDVAGLEGQARLELFPVCGQGAVDLL